MSSQTAGPSAVVICGIFGPITVFVFTARIWARQVLQKGNIGFDDWVLLAAMVFFVAQVIVTCILTEVTGFNRHVWDVTSGQRITQEKYFLAQELLYVLSSNLVKISVLTFYRRFGSREVSPFFVHTLWALIASQVCTVVTAVILLSVACLPTQSIWAQHDPTWVSVHSYHCLPRAFLWPFASGVSACQDLIATFVPLPVVMGVRTRSSWQRLGMLAMFSGGFFLSLLGVARGWLVSKLYAGGTDETWYGYFYVLLAVVEVGGGVICCSLPALKAYFNTERDRRVNFFGLRRRHSTPRTETTVRAGSVWSRSMFGKLGSTGSAVTSDPGTLCTMIQTTDESTAMHGDDWQTAGSMPCDAMSLKLNTWIEPKQVVAHD